MQEEVIQQLHQQVQDLNAKVEGQSALVEQLRVVQQRQRTDVRDARVETRSYGSMNADAIEGLQDQMNTRFEDVHTRLDGLTEDLAETKANTETILAILRSNVKRAVKDPNTEE